MCNFSVELFGIAIVTAFSRKGGIASQTRVLGGGVSSFSSERRLRNIFGSHLYRIARDINLIIGGAAKLRSAFFGAGSTMDFYVVLNTLDHLRGAVRSQDFQGIVCRFRDEEVFLKWFEIDTMQTTCQINS